MKKNAPFFENLVRQKKSYVENTDIVISFKDGARVDIRGFSKSTYKVEFWNRDVLEYRADLKPGYFASPSKRFYVPWVVKVFENNKLIMEKKLELEGLTVHILIDSKSLGDSLAWVPQIYRFMQEKKCKVILTTYLNDLFEKHYPEISWNKPGTVLPAYDCAFKIGYFMGDDKFSYTPFDPRLSTLGKVPCDILGISYKEERPRMSSGFSRPIAEKYVCIATHSTAGAKYWHRSNGWQDTIDYLNMIGYKVVVLQKEKNDYKNVIDLSGDKPLEERLAVLEHCEFFIGLGSGMSWLAWSMKKPVILISGFSNSFAEFELDCIRLINRNVCNSCWNDPTQTFDKGDWWWCPRLKGTDRAFECSKEISVISVIEAIETLLVSSTV